MTATHFYLILVAFAAAMIAFSIYLYRRENVASTLEYVMAGRRVNSGFMIASFIATWMWAADIAAVPQTVYYTGVAGIWYYGLPVLVSGLLAAIVIRRVRKVLPEVVTYQHFFRRRLDRKNHLVYIGIGIYTMVIAAMLQIRVGGEIVAAMTGLDPLFVCFLLLLVIAAYTTISGLWASVATDYVQFATAAILTVVFVPVILFNAGGPAEVFSRIEANWLEINPGILRFDGVTWDNMYHFFLPFVFVWGAWGFASMSIWQRGLAVRRDRITRTYVFGSIGWFSTIPVYGVIGLVALAYFPDLTGPGADFSVDNSADAGILVYTQFLGGMAQIVFVLTLLALLMSTADSALIALASLTSRDIYQENIAPAADERQTLAVARLAVPFWAAVIMLVTWGMIHIDFLTCIWINGIGTTALLFPLLYSLFSRRISPNAIFATAVVVILSLIYWFFFSGAVDFSEGTFGDLVPMYIVGYLEALILPPLLSLFWKHEFDFATLTAETPAPAAKALGSSAGYGA